MLEILYGIFRAARARLFSYHRKRRGRFDKKCRFQKGQIGFRWPFHMNFSALRARPFSSHRKMRGTIWRKVPIFEEEIEFGWPFYIIVFIKNDGDKNDG